MIELVYCRSVTEQGMKGEWGMWEWGYEIGICRNGNWGTRELELGYAEMGIGV